MENCVIQGCMADKDLANCHISILHVCQHCLMSINTFATSVEERFAQSTESQAAAADMFMTLLQLLEAAAVSSSLLLQEAP